MSYKNMDPKFKKRWLKALRTPLDEGGYRQTDGKLWNDHGDGDAFCCLGVACNLFALDGEVTWNDRFIETEGYHGGKVYPQPGGTMVSLDTMGMPPVDILGLMGMSPKAAGRVADLNDDGQDFVQIAQWIEEHL